MDDIAENMNWQYMDRCELLFDKFKLKPLLGVIPENKDPELLKYPKNSDFWNRVANWKKKGWEIFTDKIISLISEKHEHIVFILWGNFAQQKVKLIDEKKHFIIKSVHPSPFSARNGFFDSKPFSKCNEYLTSVNKENIDWDLADDCQQLSILD